MERLVTKCLGIVFIIALICLKFSANENQDDVYQDSADYSLQEYPYFLKQPDDVVADVGSNVVIDCIVGGNPKPSISWQGDSFEALHILPNNSLAIPNITAEDSGRYYCYAENSLGSIFGDFLLLVRVHGGLDQWSRWSVCSSSCGPGEQKRYRLCSNPPPRNGGRPCEGDLVETVSCVGDNCNVDGGFGKWSDWTHCSQSCNGGNQSRFRHCDSPITLGTGKPCNESESVEFRVCNLIPCGVDGGYGVWSNWSKCSEKCDGGQQHRMRSCDSPAPQGNGRKCDKDAAVEFKLCNQFSCKVPRHIENVLGEIGGSINDVLFGGVNMMTTIPSNDVSKVLISGRLERAPAHLVNTFRNLNGILIAPLYWGIMKTESNDNGFQLSGGIFDLKGQLTCPDDKVLHFSSSVNFIADTSVPFLNIHLAGNVPSFVANSSLNYEERVIQIQEGFAYGYSQQILHTRNGSIMCSVSYNITYNSTEEIMSPPHRAYQVRNINGENTPELDMLGFSFEVHGGGISTCPSKFQLNGKFCQDIDECVLVDDLCNSTDICINEPGGYKCVTGSCPHGYTYNNSSGRCEDFDECTSNNPCRTNQICFNTIGSFSCEYSSCEGGFMRNLATGQCEDIDECKQNQMCEITQICKNLNGSFRCEEKSCSYGYSLNSSGVCVDIDECFIRTGNCSNQEVCRNTIGSFHCILSPCLFGYERDQNEDCVDTDECALIPSPCGIHEECDNDVGTYFCYPRCAGGFQFNKHQGTCDDIDECAMNSNNCPVDTQCINHYGFFQCIPKFMLVDATHSSITNAINTTEIELQNNQISKPSIEINISVIGNPHSPSVNVDYIDKNASTQSSDGLLNNITVTDYVNDKKVDRDDTIIKSNVSKRVQDFGKNVDSGLVAPKKENPLEDANNIDSYEDEKESYEHSKNTVQKRRNYEKVGIENKFGVVLVPRNGSERNLNDQVTLSHGINSVKNKSKRITSAAIFVPQNNYINVGIPMEKFKKAVLEHPSTSGSKLGGDTLETYKVVIDHKTHSSSISKATTAPLLLDSTTTNVNYVDISTGSKFKESGAGLTTKLPIHSLPFKEVFILNEKYATNAELDNVNESLETDTSALFTLPNGNAKVADKKGKSDLEIQIGIPKQNKQVDRETLGNYYKETKTDPWNDENNQISRESIKSLSSIKFENDDGNIDGSAFHANTGPADPKYVVLTKVSKILLPNTENDSEMKPYLAMETSEEQLNVENNVTQTLLIPDEVSIGVKTEPTASDKILSKELKDESFFNLDKSESNFKIPISVLLENQTNHLVTLPLQVVTDSADLLKSQMNTESPRNIYGDDINSRDHLAEVEYISHKRTSEPINDKEVTAVKDSFSPSNGTSGPLVYKGDVIVDDSLVHIVDKEYILQLRTIKPILEDKKVEPTSLSSNNNDDGAEYFMSTVTTSSQPTIHSGYRFSKKAHLLVNSTAAPTLDAEESSKIDGSKSQKNTSSVFLPDTQEYGTNKTVHGNASENTLITERSKYQDIKCSIGYRKNTNGHCVDIDECQENPPCQESCTNLPGLFECSCKYGFELQPDGFSCKDLDECEYFRSWCGDHECINLVGSWKCVAPCKLGFKRNANHQCEDINECKESAHHCGPGNICINTKGGYRCACPRGFKMRLPGRVCVDINECKRSEVRTCEQKCINTIGSFSCSCYSGFQLRSDGVTCQRSIVPFVRKNDVSEALSQSTESRIKPRPTCYYININRLCRCDIPFVYNKKTRECEILKEKQEISKTLNSPSQRKEITFRNTAKQIIITHAPKTEKLYSLPKTARKSEAPVSTTATVQACPQWFSYMCDWKCEVKGLYRRNQCLCPSGYRKYYYGRCKDKDECRYSDKELCSRHEKCFNTKGSYKCVDYSCPKDFTKIAHGSCEKTCLINGRSNYCRREYVHYHVLALRKDTQANQKLITLRAHDDIVDNIGRARFYIQNGNVNFKLRSFRDRAEMMTTRLLRQSGSSDVVIISDIFDGKSRLLCRTKFVIYIDVGDYIF